jgi:hypothetical protein
VRLRQLNANPFGGTISALPLQRMVYWPRTSLILGLVTLLHTGKEERIAASPAHLLAKLTDVGNGGAGPYYGLFSLEQYDEYLDDLPADFLARPFPHSAAWNADEAELDARAVSPEYTYFGNAWVQGALRICHYGCGVFLLLAVNGAARGSIWADDRGSDQGIYPWGNFTSFTAWYEDWLDRSLEQLTKP